MRSGKRPGSGRQRTAKTRTPTTRKATARRTTARKVASRKAPARRATTGKAKASRASAARKPAPPRKTAARPAGRTARRRAEREQQRKRLVPHSAALGLVLAAVLVSSLYPARQLVANRNRVAALRRESAKLDRTIADLLARREALQTDEEIERLARQELGMIRRGETAFAVVPAQSRPPVPAAARVDASSESGGVVARWWRAFSDSLLRVR